MKGPHLRNGTHDPHLARGLEVESFGLVSQSFAEVTWAEDHCGQPAAGIGGEAPLGIAGETGEPHRTADGVTGLMHIPGIARGLCLAGYPFR